MCIFNLFSIFFEKSQLLGVRLQTQNPQLLHHYVV